MRHFFVPFLLLFSCCLSAQTLESEVKPDGIIFPRMSTIERDTTIISPQQGQCIFNTDREKVECYTGVNWGRTSYYALAASAFHTENDDNTVQWIAGASGAYYITAPLAFRGMLAGVNLPHQSKLVRITIYYEDLDNSNSCRFDLGHNNSSNANFSTIDTFAFSMNTVLGTPGILNISTDIDINNQENAYFFSMRPVVANTLDIDFKLYKVVFQYIEDAASVPPPMLINQIKPRKEQKNTEVKPSSSARLHNNQPNPFSESTTLRYFIPESVTQAELRITNANGETLKVISITSKGEGRTTLEAHALSAGNYFYSLVLDGKVLETKQMVLVE